jgi:hypothetical protein
VFIEVFYGKYVDGRYCDWEHRPHTYEEGLKMLHRGIRIGRWKLVHNGTQHRLYDLQDMDDVTNLAGTHQRIFEALVDFMETKYPIRDIMTSYHFDRQSIFQKCF